MINCCIDELIDIVNTATWGQSDRGGQDRL